MIKEELRNVALFIDFENFGADKEINFRADNLLDMIDLPREARIIMKRAYADWGRFPKFKQQMLENSIELIEMPSHGKRGKNGADMKLTVDALETALMKEYVDAFVIVSGDSDYTSLISKLREYDKYVIVVGHSKSTSKLLAGYCDEIIYYASLTESEVEVSDLNTAYKYLTSAIKALLNEGAETTGSGVKSRIKQVRPGFSESEYGFAQWRGFLRQAAADKVVDLSHASDGDVLVSLPRQEKKEEGDQLPNLSISRDFLAQLCKAIKESEHEGRSMFSRINDRLLKHDPAFSPTRFGISKTQGFSGLMRRLSEEGYVQIYRKDQTYSAAITEKMQRLTTQS